MEFPATVPPTVRPFWRRPAAVLALVALGAYAALLAAFLDPYAAGSDTSGYLNHAKLLASGHLHVPMRAIEGLPAAGAPYDIYTPLGLKPAPDGNGLVPTYPSGLPLLIFAAARVVGWGWASNLVLGAHAILGVLLTYALGRALQLPAAWAVLGATMIAVSPLYLLYSVQIMSDVPSLVWVVAAVLAAWRSGDRDLEKRPSTSSGGSLWALGAGASLALAVLIRPNSIIALVPVGIALGLSPKRWLMLGLGSLPGAIFFCVHANAAYGSALATGYGSNLYLFSLRFIPGTLLNYGKWLPLLFTPVVVLSLGLPWLGRGTSRTVAVIGAWIIVYLAFYSIYSVTHETWWYLRFLLPAAPPLVAGGLLVARRWFRFPFGTAAFAVAFGLTLGNGVWRTRDFGVLNTAEHDRTYPLAMAWLRGHVPANAVLAVWQASGAVFYYTPFAYFRWERLDENSFGRITTAAQKAGRPIYAVLFPLECDPALKLHMRGSWTQAGAIREVTVWRWNGREADTAK